MYMHFDEIGKYIYKTRKNKKITQAQLGLKLGMSRATISGIENGTVSEIGIRKDFSKAISKFDDLTLLEIIGQFQIGRLRFIQPGENLEVMPALNVNELLTNDCMRAAFHAKLA